jgi:hypothetical protein
LHLYAKIQKILLDFRALAGGGFWGGSSASFSG